MATLATPLIIGGTLLQAGAQFDAAGEAKHIGRIQSAELERQATQVVAASQRGAMEQRRQTEFASSRAMALAAASGGGVDDPTILKLLGDLEEEGAYRASVELYQGEEEARRLRSEARIAKMGGRYESRQLKTQALSTLLSGGGSLLAKYTPKE